MIGDIAQPDQINLNSVLLGLLSIVLTAVIGLWMRSSGVKNQRITDLETAVKQLQLDAAVNETKVTPLWARVQKAMNDELHHPHAEDQEADGLIDKLERLEATPSETARLKVLFQERAVNPDPKISPRERSIAKIMPVIMDLVLEEAASPEDLTEVEAVAAAPIKKLKDKQEGE